MKEAYAINVELNVTLFTPNINKHERNICQLYYQVVNAIFILSEIMYTYE